MAQGSDLAGEKAHATTRRQIVGLDALRFAAALWVVLHHLAYWAQASPSFTHQSSGGLGEFGALRGISQIGWLGVPIFFVISGFVIAYSAERATPFGFVVSRFVRLVPAMWICATVTLAVSAAFHLLSYRFLAHQSLNSVLFHPAGPWIDDSTWTLWIEISFYLLVWALLQAGRIAHLRTLALAIGVASSAHWLAYEAVGLWGGAEAVTRWHAAINDRLMNLLLLRHGMYFAIGVLLWAWLVKGRRERLVGWLALFCAAGALQIAYECSGHDSLTGHHTPLLPPVLAFFGFLLCFTAAVRGNDRLHGWLGPRALATLRTLGLMTYPLYLLHQNAGAYLLGATIRATGSSYAALGLVVGLALLASWLVAVHLEPPLQRWCRAWLWRARGGWIGRRAAPATGD